jgi:hypothetical protein
MITINGIFRPLSAATNASPSTPAPAEDTEKTFFGAQLKQVADSFSASTSVKTESSSTAETAASPKESTASTAPVTVTAQTTAVSAAVKNFIEWQGAQPNPLGQGTIADVWAKQGITEPMSNPVLISQAETQLNRAEQRSAMNPSYVAEWKGDWKTHMAEAKAAETQRQIIMAEADAINRVTVGGGIVQMMG